MFFAPVQHHLPKSPLRKRDQAIRAELTHASTRLVKLEREQELQFQRIAQIQQELDEIKRLLRKIGSEH
jgi:hypothetical protein